MSKYELRASPQGTRVVDLETGETVILNGRVLDGLSYTAAIEIRALLDRRDALRAEHVKRVAGGNDLAAILELAREGGAPRRR